MNTQSEYDFVFCGAGASASLLLLSMHERRLLDNKSILILDKEEKNRRDKTFCFWSTHDELIERSLRSIISHSWSEVILPNSNHVLLAPLQYQHVSSLDLYQKIDELAVHYGIKRIYGIVHEIEYQGDFYQIKINDEHYSGKLVFDSRTPAFKLPERHESHIHQSFIGWRVKLRGAAKFPEAFRFMDFNVEQQHNTQFMYVLPYADGSALIELTRFGADILLPSEAEALLTDYIEHHYGEFEKIDEEHGCIPMSTSAIQDSSPPGIIQLGARNYTIKPSTGYAFKRMFYHAEDIAASLAEETTPTANNRGHAEAFSGRFAFYDGLLLDILTRHPHQGKRIFESLFKHNTISSILTFLDERSKLSSEIAIFSRLPLVPFLNSLWRKISIHVAFVPGILVLLCTLLAVLPMKMAFLQVMASSAFVIGLVTVGIPHGALDHLLESRQWDTTKLPSFVLKYLSIGAIMALIWSIAPTFSLLIFILYSSWHFGQADGKQWGMSAPLSLAWGASVLIFILGSHLNETNAIIETMGTSAIPVAVPVWTMVPWFIAFALKRNIAGLFTVTWLIISSQIPLMFAFGLYFIGQHSLTGWKHIQRHLGMTHKKLWLHALPFHAGAWLLLALFIWAQGTMKMESHYFGWGNFFIFLACISLPHAIAMQHVYRGKTTD